MIPEAWSQGMEERCQRVQSAALPRTETIELDGSAVRVFVNLDVTSPGLLKSFLRKVGSVALVAVFAVRRRTRVEEGNPFSRRAPGVSLAELRGMQRGGRGCFQFQTETTSEVAADALLALLYAKHAGPRNYLISSATERERQQCFRELLCLDESKKTIWLSGTDLEPQKLFAKPKARPAAAPKRREKGAIVTPATACGCVASLPRLNWRS
ncbi:unnamed protein product [Symbiodinium necroappetens]|uniref:Uncharacterized protein n=1 Tax=Symbiodinium necroappetens TaxID=1628268 RepID=A0A813CGW0_9DINO|nr:unnamed protein product [Symbiodinium necroappetens]